MLYTQKSFTLPVGSFRITQEQWDKAVLPRIEFAAKYYPSDKPIEVSFHSMPPPIAGGE